MKEKELCGFIFSVAPYLHGKTSSINFILNDQGTMLVSLVTPQAAMYGFRWRTRA